MTKTSEENADDSNHIISTLSNNLIKVYFQEELK